MKADPPPDGIREAYLGAVGLWSGCDWPTRFGVSALDLNGMRSSQALLMARATAGDEAADWRAAADWLAAVEADARQAEALAQAAVTLASAGVLGGALQRARRACAAEEKYHRRPVWGRLRDAVEAVLVARAEGP